MSNPTYDNVYKYVFQTPYGPDYPSDDQSEMLKNTISIAGLINFDHVGFKRANGGFHRKVTFNSTNPPQANPTNTSSILYTNPGQASSSPQMYWRNNSRTNPETLIKAYVLFGTGATIFTQPTIKRRFNVESVKLNGFGGLPNTARYVIKVKNNVLVGNFPGIIISGTTPNNFIYTNGELILFDVPVNVNINILFLQN